MASKIKSQLPRTITRELGHRATIRLARENTPKGKSSRIKEVTTKAKKAVK